MTDIRQTEFKSQPLDAGLNAAVLEIAARLLPTGFDVAEDAPGTYASLKAHLDAGKRLVVYAGGSEGTIYVSPAVNHAFRAWHDFTHWKGSFDFSLAGERAVAETQCRELLQLYGDTATTRRWCSILRAEVVGQREFFHIHKRYVGNQRGFVLAYLDDPEMALLWSLW